MKTGQLVLQCSLERVVEPAESPEVLWMRDQDHAWVKARPADWWLPEGQTGVELVISRPNETVEDLEQRTPWDVGRDDQPGYRPGLAVSDVLELAPIDPGTVESIAPLFARARDRRRTSRDPESFAHLAAGHFALRSDGPSTADWTRAFGAAMYSASYEDTTVGAVSQVLEKLPRDTGAAST